MTTSYDMPPAGPPTDFTAFRRNVSDTLIQEAMTWRTYLHIPPPEEVDDNGHQAHVKSYRCQQCDGFIIAVSDRSGNYYWPGMPDNVSRDADAELGAVILHLIRRHGRSLNGKGCYGPG